MRRPPSVVRAFCASAVLGLSALAACGGGEADAPRRTPPATEAGAFVTPLGADILLAELELGPDGRLSIGTPTNVTQRPGYDNQPHFTPDGSGVWYTAVDEHDGQADIWRYDPATRAVTRVTQSNPESEYSATPLPDSSGISTIRVEADSTQRLWRFDFDGSNASVLLPGVAPVGYHAWSGERTVVMFVLGDPATLQRADVRTGRAAVVARDIGRSIQPIPGGDDVSWVQRHGPDRATIMRLAADGSAPTPIVDAVDGGDFHAWTPDGTLLMAGGAVVYALSPGASDWLPIADFTELRISISRLAVRPDGAQIAMVAEVAALEGLGSD